MPLPAQFKTTQRSRWNCSGMSCLIYIHNTDTLVGVTAHTSTQNVCTALEKL